MNQNKGNVFKFFALLLLGNVFQSTTTAVYANANDYTQVAENSYSSWSIIVIADFHGAETFSFDTNTETNTSFQYHLDVLKYVKTNYGGDMILLPGDSQDGKWFKDTYIDKHFPGMDAGDVVYKASINCYTTLRKLLTMAGYEKTLMAVGDHELGDNGWFVPSIKTDNLKNFRKGFADGFNSNAKKGFFYRKNLVGDSKAVVQSTPKGTAHENLSYAHQHKNVLFITVDLYEQVSTTEDYVQKKLGRGGEGAVTGTVIGQHLEWFEAVLSHAKNDSSTIKHIIVQAHIPVKEPVRKVKSSAMIVDDGEKSDFWELMVKYGVDLYLCGEVHSTTATKDGNSKLVQIASRGNDLNNFMKIKVEDDKIRVIHYNEVGYKPKGNKNYEVNGELVIDKSRTKTTIQSDGALKLLYLKKPLIRFNFEKKIPLKNRQVIGLKNLSTTMIQNNKPLKIGLVAKQTQMRGVTCTQSLPNSGEFGQPYDAQAANLDLRKDGSISGKSFAFFNGSTSRHSIYGFGPHSAGSKISFSLWIRTFQKSEVIITHYGAAWGDVQYDYSRSIFSLTLDDGQPKLYASENTYATTKDSLSLNDKEWHHIAISMPSKNCLLSEVTMYIDGIKRMTETPNNDETLFFISYGRISLGGLGYSAKNYESRFPNWKPYKGSMDEFRLWGRTIGDKEVALSMNKNFDKVYDRECVKNDNTKQRRIMEKSLTKLQCHNICQKKATCKGYEGTKLADGYNRCILFFYRPVTSTSVTKKSVCAIMR